MKETSSGIIVYYKEKNIVKYLILHYQADHWDFPKGHVESGESLKQTALRETKEETNLDVEIKPFFNEKIEYKFKRRYELIDKEVYYFIGQAQSTEVILSHEHVGFEWLKYEQAIERLSYDNSKELLKKASKLIETI